MNTKESTELKWLEPKGKTFERIVGVLLKNMFPKITFKQTRYVHDGGKDFYTIADCDSDRIWVEAKNYTNHLELSKFANTFIMADINEIKRLIIFSVSPLTENARINVARYASFHNKQISIYSGIDVLLLIKKYKKHLSFKNYFTNPTDVKNYIESLNLNNENKALSVNNQYYRTKQFNLAYRRDGDNGILPCVGTQLSIFSKIAHEIILTNHSLFNEQVLTIKESYFNNSNFEFFLPDGFERKIIIPPASTVVVVIFLKLTTLSDSLSLPAPEFDIEIKEIAEKRVIECCWIGEIPLIGSAWERLQELKENVRCNNLNQALLFGKSGVGKTRFIQESASEFYKTGYRIISLDFRSLKQITLNNMLKKIICKIYVIDEDNPDDSIYSDDSDNINGVFRNILFNGKYDCKKNQAEIISLFCGLFQNKKIALLLDNIQDLDGEATDFLIQLSQFIVGNNTINSFILYCFNTEFFGEHNTSKRLFNYLTLASACYKIELSNFSIKEAKLYLKECLDPTGIRKDLNSCYDAIINKFKTNPFVLKQLILYLKQRQIINFTGSAVYISDYATIPKILDEIPHGIQEILNCRYEYLIKEYGSETDLKRIIWCIMFFGGVSKSLIQEIDNYERSVRLLNSYGFTENDEKFRLVFSHQLIEKYFCLKTSNGSLTSVPQLSFLNDKEFLCNLLSIISVKFSNEYCIQEMLLRRYLKVTNKSNVVKALNRLCIITPEAILLPLIINVAVDIFDGETEIPHKLELEVAYRLCVSCQNRFYNTLAANICERLINFERQTFCKKIDAAYELISFFKHYVFLLPLIDKQNFLFWLDDNAEKFGLHEVDFLNFRRWIYNRLSKNLCSLHDFDGAEKQIKRALEIATKLDDLGAIAEDELEYGNIFAYYDGANTAEHWYRCAKHIAKIKDKSIYFRVYELTYGILADLLCGKKIETSIIDNLRSLRKQTFLYQKLLIDDVCADILLINYADNPQEVSLQNQVIPMLENMKSDSFMYDSKFTILASYKLMSSYMLIDKAANGNKNMPIIINLIMELIDNGLFEGNKLEYSDMILCDIAKYCFDKNELCRKVSNRLSDFSRVRFKELVDLLKSGKVLRATTLLSDKEKTLNLLHFNYVF